MGRENGVFREALRMSCETKNGHKRVASGKLSEGLSRMKTVLMPLKRIGTKTEIFLLDLMMIR